MNYLKILSNNTKSYLPTIRFSFLFIALATIIVGISSCNKNELPEEGSIEDLTPPSAVFSYTASPDDYREITFSNSSISATDHAWDFGDGNTSPDAEPVHTYAADGTYIVSLTASDKNNAVSTVTDTIILVAPPLPLSADFSFEVSATDFNSVTFTNLSISADTYSWDLGDGTTSTDENPTHTYAAEFGSYDVVLTASNSVTGETETATRTVNIIDPFAELTAVFSYAAGDPNTYEITFTNLSSGATDYLWDFGDGNTSTDASPVHIYAAPGGTFTVTLTSSNLSGGSETTTQTIVVSIPAPTFLPVILEPGFEDNTLPDGTGDGRDSWRDAGEELGGVIQITTGPLVSGLQAAKLPNDNSRVGYQMITVEAYQNYILRFNYTMKTDPAGTLTVAILNSDVNDLAMVDGAIIESITVSDQTDANAYIQETISFNSGANTEVYIYFKNDGVECRLDDFSIEHN